ncbi:ricin B lectin domain-containing protein [Favolaschia claudopus]|uniref:Ricin B lectin domain-containing protein n=1 Tax=Favolaschia claudopus TaxID=2862362 RepID=A0AAW0AHL6_9AGAR
MSLLRPMVVDSGFYTITNMGSRTRIDLERGSKRDGTKVVGWAPHEPTHSGYLNQVWEIRPSKNEGCYTIVNAKTGTYLEAVVDSVDDSGVQVTCSKACEDKPSSQEWYLCGPPETAEYLGSCGIVHRDAASRLLLDLAGGSSTNGTKIQILHVFDFIGSVTELLWLIKPAEYSKPGSQLAVDTMPGDPGAIQKSA